MSLSPQHVARKKQFRYVVKQHTKRASSRRGPTLLLERFCYLETLPNIQVDPPMDDSLAMTHQPVPSNNIYSNDLTASASNSLLSLSPSSFATNTSFPSPSSEAPSQTFPPSPENFGASCSIDCAIRRLIYFVRYVDIPEFRG